MTCPSTILLVEDNPDDVLLTRRAFKKGNILNQITVVRDGVEAIEYLFREGRYAGRPAETPNLVLLDLNLPRVNGFEVLKRLRSDPATHLIPVVILTSSKQEEDVIRGYELGTNSYIRKPVDFDQFVEAVRQLGMYWLVLNENPTTSATVART